MSQTLDRFRSSTWGWLRGTLAGWGTLLLIPVGAVGALVTGTPFPLGFIALAALIAAAKWFQNLATTYEVTEDRLILHRGILRKSIDETTAGRPFVIRYVEHAQARREKLRDLVNAARRARGVREFDMVQEATLP